MKIQLFLHILSHYTIIMNTLKRLIIGLLFTLIGILSQAAPKYYGLSSSEGLSNSSVMCMTQDSKGLMWIGTWDGLNVYDSYKFKIYRHDPNDINTISNNIILGIEEQESGIMWISTNYGINRIDTENETIRRFYPGYESKAPLVEKTFSTGIVDGKDVFMAARDYGVTFYDENSGSVSSIKIPGIRPENTGSIYGASNKRFLLLTTSGNLHNIRYDISNGTPEIISAKEMLDGTKARSIFKCRSSIWIICEDNSLYRYDCLINSLKFAKKIRPEIYVTSIAETNGNKVAIASYPSGVYIYDFETGHINMEERLSDVNLLSLYYGSQNILWAGTDGQGLRALYDDSFDMGKISNDQISKSKNYPVRAFHKDKGSNLFVGTKGNGISVFKDNEIIRSFSTSDGLGNNSVYAFTEGLNNDILLGHDGIGLNAISLETWKVTSILPDHKQSFGSTYSFYKDPEDGAFWLGTYRDGLIRIKLSYRNGQYKIEEFKAFKNDKNDTSSINSNNVFPIVGQEGILWVGTRGGGLCRYDKSTGKFRSYTTKAGKSPISSNEILSLHLSKDSTLWIGTGYGINRLISAETGEFESFTTKNGLLNNTIAGIEEDNKGNLWLSTNKGISLFNPRTRSFINYSDNDALQDNEFADGAYYCSPDGLMYFGGRDGFNYFNPADINARPFQPKVIIRDFNVRQNPFQGFSPEKDVLLNYDENFFSIHYTALEYINSNSCEYAYMLKGFNDEWVYAGSGHEASYTNVPPGKYTFIVRCTNGDKLWSDKETAMHISIRPPWWQTLYAKIGYTLLAICALAGAAAAINSRSKRKYRQKVELLKQKQLSETYEAKLRFFTNIAHEFTTPLTLICGPLDQIENNYNLPAKVEQYHRVIRNNAGRLLQLIEELIEFRRVDAGHQKPHYSIAHLNDSVSTILDNFSELKNEKQIELHLSFNGPNDVITDQGALDKILYNIISNAYKYTPDGGYINIRTSEEANKCFRISIRNSGKGIKPENLSRVFDRFVILDTYEHQASQGNTVRNGIGMALVHSLVKMLAGEISVDSKLNCYTEFIITLPNEDESLVERVQEGIPSQNIRTFKSEVEYDRTGTNVASKHEGTQKSILIVDDDKQILDLVRDILCTEYTANCAANGKDAIEKLKSGNPDLIISDLKMPEMDGISLLKKLKSDDVTKFIPVVFLAFKGDIEDEIKTYEMGCDAFIPKPFHPKHLLAVVHQVLAKRDQLKKYYNSAASSIDVYDGEMVNTDDKKFLMSLSEIIEQNLNDENLSPVWLCEKMMMSKVQFYRKLKDLTQQTPSEFIRTVKLNKAVHLLKTTNLTIQEIMYSSGFNNKSYFYREFAAKYNMSPKEFRNTNKDIQ